MKDQKILAQRYAQALLDITKESGNSAELAEQLQGFCALLRNNTELHAVYTNPVFDQEKRQSVVKAIAEQGGYVKTLRNFLSLLIDKKRANLVYSIAESFQQMLDAQNSLLHVRVASSEALSELYLAQLKAQLEHKTNKTVTLHTEVDPSLIGGVVTWIGDKMYDGTIQTQLREMKSHLLSRLQ